MEEIIDIIKYASRFSFAPNYNKGIFKSNRLKSITAIILTLGFACICIYEKWEMKSSHIKISRLLHALSGIILTINQIFTIYKAMKHKLYQKLSDSIKCIDKLFYIQVPKIKTVNTKFLTILMFSSCSYFYFVELFHSKGIGWTFIFIFQDMIFINLTTVTITLMHYILKMVKVRWETLNFAIKNLEVDDLEKKIPVLIIIQNELCNLIDGFNLIFGGNSVMIMGHIVVDSLLTLIVGFSASPHIKMLINVIFWMSFLLVQAVAVATMCEKVCAEGKKTISISYNALNEFSKTPGTQLKLLILAHQASARSPQFTAAGFFNVDFSMLFTFINLITTYIIVIMQFLFTNNCNMECNN